MDDVDKAQIVVERERAVALRNVLNRKNESAEYDADGFRVCVDCGVIIPPRRTEQVNAVRCVGCQTVRESRNRNHIGR